MAVSLKAVNYKYTGMPKGIVIIILSLLIILFSVSNFMILGNICYPLDSSEHLKHTLMIAKNFAPGGFLKNPSKIYHDVILSDKDYPPLYHILSAVIFYFLGVNFVFMASTLFLILLFYCTYKIGKTIKGETAGLLSAVIVSLYPIIYLSSRDFNLELAQAAMVCASLYLLIRADEFKNRRYSFLFWFIFALGMLIKQTVFIFIIGPLFTVLFAVFRNRKAGRAQLINMLLGSLMFGLICFCFFYYIIYFKGYLQYIFVRSKLSGELSIDPLNWLNARHILFYFNSLKNYQIGIFNLSLFLFAALIFCFKKEYKKYCIFLLSWLIIPLIGLTFVPAKYTKYTISYLPVLAIITSLGILCIKSLVIKRGAIFLTLIVNIFLFYRYIFPEDSRYSLPPPVNNFLEKINISSDKIADRSHHSYLLKSKNSNYKAAVFLKGLLLDGRSKVGVVSYLGATNLWLATDIEMVLSLYTPYEAKNLILDPTADELGACDIIIFVSSRGSGTGEKWINRKYFIQQITNFNEQQLEKTDGKILKDTQQFFILYILYKDISLIPRKGAYFPISQSQLEKVVNYYPKLELIKKIDGFGLSGDIFIYKNR